MKSQKNIKVACSLYAILLIFLVNFFLMGCGTTRVYPPAGTSIESKSLKFTMPKGNFYAFRKKFKRTDVGREYFHTVREYPGERYTIDIDHYTRGGISPKFKHYQHLFNPHFNFKKYFSSITDVYKKRKDKRFKQFRYTGYYKGLLCEKRDLLYYNKEQQPKGKTNYYKMVCGYYDTVGEKHILKFSYTYQANTKKGYLPSYDVSCKEDECDYLTLVGYDLKRKMSHILDSLVIKDIDIERMKREGLYHPNKKFRHSPR